MLTSPRFVDVSETNSDSGYPVHPILNTPRVPLERSLLSIEERLASAFVYDYKANALLLA